MADVIEKTEPKPPSTSIDVETAVINQVATLIGYPIEQVASARTRLTLLGDPERRIVLEQVARRPQSASNRLPRVTGLTIDDVHHRIRSLRNAGILIRDPHHIYRADPDALKAFASYVDVLLTIAALHEREVGGD